MRSRNILEDGRVGSHGDGGQFWPLAWRKRLLVAFLGVIDWPWPSGPGERQQNLLLASEADRATHTPARRSTKYLCGSVVGGAVEAARSAVVAIGRHSIGSQAPPGPRPVDGRRRGLGFTWLATTTHFLSTGVSLATFLTPRQDQSDWPELSSNGSRCHGIHASCSCRAVRASVGQNQLS